MSETTEEYEERLERKVKTWEEEHPDVDCKDKRIHPYFEELLAKIAPQRLRQMKGRKNEI